MSGTRGRCFFRVDRFTADSFGAVSGGGISGGAGSTSRSSGLNRSNASSRDILHKRKSTSVAQAFQEPRGLKARVAVGAAEKRSEDDMPRKPALTRNGPKRLHDIRSKRPFVTSAGCRRKS